MHGIQQIPLKVFEVVGAVFKGPKPLSQPSLRGVPLVLLHPYVRA